MQQLWKRRGKVKASRQTSPVAHSPPRRQVFPKDGEETLWPCLCRDVASLKIDTATRKIGCVHLQSGTRTDARLFLHRSPSECGRTDLLSWAIAHTRVQSGDDSTRSAALPPRRNLWQSHDR